jgi:hypothetical protein
VLIDPGILVHYVYQGVVHGEYNEGVMRIVENGTRDAYVTILSAAAACLMRNNCASQWIVGGTGVRGTRQDFLEG